MITGGWKLYDNSSEQCGKSNLLAIAEEAQ